MWNSKKKLHLPKEIRETDKDCLNEFFVTNVLHCRTFRNCDWNIHNMMILWFHEFFRIFSFSLISRIFFPNRFLRKRRTERCLQSSFAIFAWSVPLDRIKISRTNLDPGHDSIYGGHGKLLDFSILREINLSDLKTTILAICVVCEFL